jgi:hypothetical protein
MMRKGLFVALVLLLAGCIILPAGIYNFSKYHPKIEKRADQLIVKIDSIKKEKDFYIYYRTDGLKNYQIRRMKLGKDGKIYYQLSIKNLYGKKLEYFILENKQHSSNLITPVYTLKNFTDKESPEIYFQDPSLNGSGAGASKPKIPFIKANGSLSTLTQIHDKSDYPGEKFSANGNLRLYNNIYDSEDNSGFDFDSTLTYMDNPSNNESNINLSSMMVRFTKNSHKVEMGDLSISNTEFSTSYLNRRGVRYEVQGKTIYFSSFYTNSQQKTGFDGFGFPPSDGNIFGTTAGFNIGPNFLVRGLFMTGKDSLDSKTMVSPEEAFREGNMFTIWSEWGLFKNVLRITGEYASSNFGKADTSDNVEKEKDDAWRAGLNLNYGVLSASAEYKKIGSDFNSIANLFLQNDREGLNSNLMLNIKSFSLTVSFMDEKNYLNSPIQPMLHTRNLMSNFSWSLSNHFRIGADFGTNNLEYDKSTGLQTGGSDMDTLKYSANVGYIAGSNGLTLRIGKTESKTFTSNIDGSISLNLMFGNFLSFNPTLSYQSTENLSDNSTSKMYNLYLNSEVTFIPQFFTLSLSGSYTKNENDISDSTSITAYGNLNFYMSRLFNEKFQPMLSLKTSYQENKYGDTKTDSVTIYLQADVSF